MPPSISIALSPLLGPVPPVDIDCFVARVGAGAPRQLVQRLLALAEIGGERAQPLRALVEGELAQPLAADLARVPDHGREIQPRARCARDNTAIHRARDVEQAAGRL